MADIDYDLAHFFAWARPRAYREFDKRMKEQPDLDPNWTFSDIMQELLDEYRRNQPAAAERKTEQPESTE